MKETCKYCEKKVGPYYRVNCIGDFFCNDECYEEYMVLDEAPNDASHPYIDDYEAVRFEYEGFLNWERDLYALLSENSIESAKENLIESIESVIDEFYDYYRSEGDDGIFSQEIYNYLLKLEEIQEKIAAWET